MYNFYEFFAGGGMVRASLDPNIWECSFANDIDKTKASIYQRNWGRNNLVVGDINELVVNQLIGKADAAWASFPCQDLSLAGKRQGLNGKRSSTFWPFISLMEDLKDQFRKPKTIIIENVEGLITSNSNEDFLAVSKALIDLGYKTGGVLIDAKNFLPQSRKRLFIIAFDSNLRIPAYLCSKTPLDSIHPLKLTAAVSKMPAKYLERWVWWNLSIPTKRKANLVDIIEEEPSSVKWDDMEKTLKILNMMSATNMQKVRAAQAYGRLLIGTLYRRTRDSIQRAEVRFDGVAGCLRTPGGGSSRQTLIFIKGDEIRSRLISPREAARLMGLPDNYILPSNYNDAYHIMGDGVVVPVVNYIFKNLIETVLSENEQINRSINTVYTTREF